MALDPKLIVTCVNQIPIVPANETAQVGFATTAAGPAMLVALSGAPVVVVVNLDLADDEVAVGGPILGGGGPGGTRQLFRGRDLGDSTSAQETVPVLAGAQALALGKAEDSAHLTGDVGIMGLGVRNDALTPFGADGDYVPLMINAAGELVVTGGGGGAQFDRDSAAGATDAGTMALVVRKDAPGSSVSADGDYSPLQVDSAGNLRAAAIVSGTVAVGPTVTPGTGATDLGKAEDAVAGSGDVGVQALAVRRDADAPDAADGDYVPLHTNAVGQLKTSGPVTNVTPGTGATDLGKAEDAVHAGGDVGVMGLAVRDDFPPAPTAPAGDYAPVLQDERGRVYVESAPTRVSSAATTSTAVGIASVALDSGFAAGRRCHTIFNGGPGPLYINYTGAAALVTDLLVPRGTYFKVPEIASATGVFGISNAAGAAVRAYAGTL